MDEYKTYWIVTNRDNHPYFVTVRGLSVKVDGYADYEFFVCRDVEDHNYHFSEAITGYCLAISDTLLEAIKAGADKLNKIGINTLNQAIITAIKQTGVSPYYKANARILGNKL